MMRSCENATRLVMANLVPIVLRFLRRSSEVLVCAGVCCTGVIFDGGLRKEVGLLSGMSWRTDFLRS